MKSILYTLWIYTTLSKFASGFKKGEVRLVGGSGNHDGRVEVFLNGQWGTVDGTPWDDHSANIVCRQVGYHFGGVAYKNAYFGKENGPIWLNDVHCVGNEPHLLNCPHGTDTSEDSHSEDAGVACNGGVRLMNGRGPDEGRVEIFINGSWGTVDEDPWDDSDAGVVCRQLGYHYGGTAFRTAHFGEGTGPIWLDDIGCNGNEPDLLSCPHGTDTSEDSHDEDVGVACAWPVRLVNGSLPSQGRVEVLINGQWGTINDRKWDDREATVICSQLGYRLGGIAYSAAHFGEGTGPILLGYLNCAGSETSLFRCFHRTVISSGSHSQDVGVACFDLTTNLCDSQPCANNGQCVNHITSFLCVCPVGFSGTLCENDPCDSNPCEHNGTCIPERNYYHCICPDAVIGLRCEVEINPCYSNPCQGTENCLRQGNNLECISLETPKVINIDIIISSILLTLALCILLVAVICLITISKMNGAIKQLVLMSSSTKDGDHVQTRFQRYQYTKQLGCVIRCDKEGQAVSKQIASSDSQSDCDLDIYENFHRH